MRRPPEHYFHGWEAGCVVVPARVAAYLESKAGLSSFRVSNRGADAEVDSVLIALHLAAMNWRGSATGTRDAAPAEPPADSPHRLTTSQAAALLQVGERAIRKAIANESLPAENINGRWVITREDIEHYRARRTA